MIFDMRFVENSGKFQETLTARLSKKQEMSKNMRSWPLFIENIQSSGGSYWLLIRNTGNFPWFLNL